MNKMYFYGCMGILAASAMLSSCSSDNDDPTPSPNPGSEVVYKQADFEERHLSPQGMGIYCRWC